MQQTSFFSEDDLLHQSNVIKRRQERLNQVRQQSKQMSSVILERVKQEAKQQHEKIENQVLAEIRNYHLKELESRRQQYEKCISEINEQHYLKLIKPIDRQPRVVNTRKLTNSTKGENSILASNCNQKENHFLNEQSAEHLTIQSQVSSKEILSKKTSPRDVNVKNRSPKKLPSNVVFDSVDENAKKVVTSNCSRKNVVSSKTKILTSLDCVKTVVGIDHESKKCCRKNKKPSCPDKISDSKLDSNPIDGNEPRKCEIDDMYNHLVHDRIRMLEQKNKMLSRQTMLIPDAANLINNKSPRFSEYFAHRYQKKNGVVWKQTDQNDEKMNAIMDDMKRVQLKKKLLLQELNNSENENDSKASLSQKEEHGGYTKSSNHFSVAKNVESNCTSDKKPSSSNTVDASAQTSQDNLYPSPIKKTSDIYEYRKSTKHTKLRQCKRMHRSDKEILVTVSDQKTKGSNDSSTEPSTNHNSTVITNASNNDVKCNRKLPVNIVVNVLSSADCKIKINKNSSEKRYGRTKMKTNLKRINNWRTLFENEEKLTESSYYSPPNNCKMNEYGEKFDDITPPESNRGIGYYVRKLLLMSPESVENLDVSSCNTTFAEESTVTSTDSPTMGSQHASSHETTESKYELNTTGNFNSMVESKYDPENVGTLLLNCLRLAANEEGETKLPYFKSVNSSCDYKSYEDEQDALSKNLFYRHFLNTAIERLLPLYQNSLDDNVETSTVSAVSDFHATKVIPNQSVDEPDMDITLDEESTYVSTSAYLQKFVSSLSSTSGKEKDKEIIDRLKQYIELPSSVSENSSISLKSDHKLLPTSPHEESYKNESSLSFPSIDELIQKGLINKAFALDEQTKNDEGKEFIDEEEFIKKMLQVDFSPKGTDDKIVPDSLNNEQDLKTTGEKCSSVTDQQNSSGKDHVGTSVDNIRKEMRLIGLNWMDTTLQRTLQASAISSTSSAEDSGAQLRNASSTKESLIQAKCSASSSENTVQSTEHFSISPITVPDVHLNIPDCFIKN